MQPGHGRPVPTGVARALASWPPRRIALAQRAPSGAGWSRYRPREVVRCRPRGTTHRCSCLGCPSSQRGPRGQNAMLCSAPSSSTPYGVSSRKRRFARHVQPLLFIEQRDQQSVRLLARRERGLVGPGAALVGEGVTQRPASTPSVNRRMIRPSGCSETISKTDPSVAQPPCPSATRAAAAPASSLARRSPHTGIRFSRRRRGEPRRSLPLRGRTGDPLRVAVTPAQAGSRRPGAPSPNSASNSFVARSSVWMSSRSHVTMVSPVSSSIRIVPTPSPFRRSSRRTHWRDGTTEVARTRSDFDGARPAVPPLGPAVGPRTSIEHMFVSLVKGRFNRGSAYSSTSTARRMPDELVRGATGAE